METNELNFDNDRQPGRTFLKRIHKKNLPDADKVDSPDSDRVQRNNELKKLNAHSTDRISYTSKYNFIVDWQMYG